jgi:multidrug resistance efflux pump
MAPAVETYHEDDQWKNRVQGNSRASNVHETKAAAQAAGRDQARKLGTEHVIKKMDGTIGEKNSYGGDDHPPRG